MSHRRQGRPRVLILLENLPLEKDARVKRECRALVEAGYAVVVICPRGTRRDVIDGVTVWDYPAPPEGGSATAFVVEYLWSLLAAGALTAKLLRWGRIDVVQACNPPDIYWSIAGPLRLTGTRFVFDHHDLSPEVYAARRGASGGPIDLALRAMERITFATATHVVSTNDSIRQVAIERGRVDPDAVTVVRNGPELSWLDRFPPPCPELKRGHRYLVAWVGVIGPDDGVEELLAAASCFVHELGRTDTLFVLIGEGELSQKCRALTERLGIADHVVFAGWLEQPEMYAHLATADLALAPDPPGERAQNSTMMKVLDYLVAGLPVIAHDVRETKVSAGDAGMYVDATPQALAEGIAALLDDPQRRAEMGEIGRARIRDGLSWNAQRERYIAVYDALTGGAR